MLILIMPDEHGSQPLINETCFLFATGRDYYIDPQCS